MKRFVKAAVISATLAAAAAIPTSCTWMEDYFKTVTDKADEPEIPLDEETFLWWDAAAEDMVPTHGRYRLQVGTSSSPKDLRSRRYRF